MLLVCQETYFFKPRKQFISGVSGGERCCCSRTEASLSRAVKLKRKHMREKEEDGDEKNEDRIRGGKCSPRPNV